MSRTRLGGCFSCVIPLVYVAALYHTSLGRSGIGHAAAYPSPNGINFVFVAIPLTLFAGSTARSLTGWPAVGDIVLIQVRTMRTEAHTDVQTNVQKVRDDPPYLKESRLRRQ